MGVETSEAIILWLELAENEKENEKENENRWPECDDDDDDIDTRRRICAPFSRLGSV